MKQIKSTLLVLLLAAPLAVMAGGQTGSIKPRIEAALVQMDKAANKRDVKTIARYLAEDVVIVLTMNTPEGKQQARLSKTQYINMLKQGFASTSAYSYKRLSSTIEVKSKTQAIVSSRIHEKMTINGQTMEGDSTEVSVFEIKDGKLVATRVEGTQL